MTTTARRRSKAPATMLARIHPPAPHHGYHAETYMLSGSGYPKFESSKGWYEVDYKTSLRLMKIRNNPNNPYSRPVFQIATREEAMAIEESEKEVVAEANSPISIPKKVRRKLTEKPKRRIHTVSTDDDIPEPVDEDAELEGWDEDDDNIPDDQGPIETADADDIAELEELERAAEESEDLTSTEVRKSETKPKRRAKKKATKKKAKKKATKAKPRRAAKKKATKRATARARS